MQRRKDELYWGLGNLLPMPLYSLSSGWKHYFKREDNATLYSTLSYSDMNMLGGCVTISLGIETKNSRGHIIAFGVNYMDFAGRPARGIFFKIDYPRISFTEKTKRKRTKQLRVLPK